jgi:uncharacterized protein with ATP-grasp and redox domains
MTSDPGSFARHTIIERKPRIIQQVIRDNNYPPNIVQALETFQEEIASRPIQPLSEQAPEVAFWNQELAAYHDKTWLQIPWYLAETYFYRRLLEAVDYFQSGPWERHDPFQKQKEEQTKVAIELLAGNWSQINGVESDVAFEALLHSCLWGNRADLSNFTVAIQARGGLATHKERQNVLIDHTDQAQELLANGLEQMAFINDNVGLDVLFDLALVDFLLTQRWVQRVIFYLKDRPFFVSDAMPKDVWRTISLLQAASNVTVQGLGARLRDHLEAGRLTLKDESFWTSYLMFRHLPPSLREELAHAGLVIIKGDVNYRRLLDDRHWPHTACMEEIADYFPAPFLVLRTLKGEIMVGLEPGQAKTLPVEDPTWLINGKRGIVQLVL